MESNNIEKPKKGFWFYFFIFFFFIGLIKLFIGLGHDTSSTYTKQDYYNEHSDGKSYEQWTKDQELLNDMKNESDRLNNQ